MFPTQDQISAATKANLEVQLAMLTSLTGKTLEGVEKIISLNMSAAKASMEESTAATRQLLAAKDPKEFFSLATAQTQPNIENALAYGSHLASIASSVQAEFVKAAEGQIAETSRKVAELVEDVAKNAPAGSENVVALVKSAIGNANASYEQFSKTTKQAVESLEANLNTAASQFTQSTGKKTASKK